MAFTPTVLNKPVAGGLGNKRVCWGTWTNDGGSTGGDVVTSLNVVEGFIPVLSGATAGALAPAVNETFPLINSNGAVTIVSNANDTGYWFAWGY